MAWPAIHIDIRVGDAGSMDPARREPLIRRAVAGAVSAGANGGAGAVYGDLLGHVVLLDPEGNEILRRLVTAGRFAAS